MASVYLIHFETPIGNPANPHGMAQHYIGFSTRLGKRLQAHLHGNGARLMEVVSERGVSWRLARTWTPGSRQLERWLKNRKNAKRFCPLCNPKAGRPHRWAGRDIKEILDERTTHA